MRARAFQAVRSFWSSVGLVGSLHGCRVLSLPKLNDDGAHGMDDGQAKACEKRAMHHACMRACLPASSL